MMHGKFNTGMAEVVDRSFPQRVADFVWARKWLLVVVAPTLLLCAYYGLFAANQYESEAHFVVRSTTPAAGASTGLSQALSLIGGVSSAGSDAASVSDYLSSHDAVDTLRDKVGLVDIFRRPEADLLSRLNVADPSPERLLRYYRGQANVKLDPDSGITQLRVRTFRPEDSYKVMEALLELGEARVNTLNGRAYESTLKVAQRQLAEAETAVADAQRAVTAFRQGKATIDPVAVGQAQISVVSGLRAALAQARAQREQMGGLSPSSPQVQAVEARIRALSAQVGGENARLAGGGNAIASNVGDYQGLLLRQQFAAKRYDDAAAAVQRAREQAGKQQLFIVRIVEPNMPVKALYPKSARVIFTVFVSLILVYACGWLIVAGVREHAA